MPSLLHKVALQQSSSSSAAGQHNGDGGRSSGGAVWTRSNTEDVSLSQLHKVLLHLRSHAASSLLTMIRKNQIKSFLFRGHSSLAIGIYFFLHPLSDIQIFRCRYWKPQHLATSGALEPLFWYRREERNSLPFYQFHLTWSWLSRESELLGIGGLTDWNRILWRSRASFGMPHVIFTRKCVAHSLCVT